MRVDDPVLGLRGITVLTDPTLPDTTCYLAVDPAGSLFGDTAKPVLMVGTKPPGVIELAGREGRQAVRRGLADVLEWIGDPVVVEPILEAMMRGVLW